MAACVVWFALFASGESVVAQSAPVPREYAAILKAIPQRDSLKLRGANKEDAALELSKLLTPEIGRTDTYRFKVNSVDRSLFPGEGITGWRIIANDEKVKLGSLSVGVEAYAYVRADPDGLLAKVKRGTVLLVTGTVNACSISARDAPRFYIHIDASSIAPAAK
jgi:hypothetical protein